MRYKIDKYAAFHESRDGRSMYAFNFRNGALARFDKNENAEVMSAISEGGVDSPLFIMNNPDFSSNFILLNHLDEKELVRNKFREIQTATNELNLTILTTLACNFSCYYCYEKRESKRLNQNVIDNILNHINKNLEKLDKIAICWYGGEPLLVHKELILLNSKIKKICRANLIQFGSKVVSNAYLLDEEMGKDLQVSGVDEIQVSFDGPREIHDKVRHQNGKASFDKIVSNVFSNKTRFNFIIRVNVSEECEERIGELLSQLDSAGLSEFTTIYFANLHSNGVGCSDMSEPQLDGLIKTSKFLRKSITYKKMALDLGFKIRTPLSTTTLCSAVIEGGMVIEPDGNMKKCYLDVSNPNESLGNLFKETIPAVNIDEKSQPITFQSKEKWVDYDPFKNEGCTDCKALPICFSGCPWEAMRGVPIAERCHPLKMGLSEYFEFFFTSIEDGAEFDPIRKTLQKLTGYASETKAPG